MKGGIESTNSKPTFLEDQRKKRKDIVEVAREAFCHATSCDPLTSLVAASLAVTGTLLC